jgi:hypothetical protein
MEAARFSFGVSVFITMASTMSPSPASWAMPSST